MRTHLVRDALIRPIIISQLSIVVRSYKTHPQLDLLKWVEFCLPSSRGSAGLVLSKIFTMVCRIGQLTIYAIHELHSRVLHFSALCPISIRASGHGPGRKPVSAIWFVTSLFGFATRSATTSRTFGSAA